MLLLNPKPPVPPSADRASATLIIASPFLPSEESGDLEVDVPFEATAPMLPMLPELARPTLESVVVPFERDELWAFAPRPSEPILPRMVTAEEFRGPRPSLARRVARKVTAFASFCAALAAVLTALALVLSFTFNVPLRSVNAISYDAVVALTEGGPVPLETIAIAPLEVQPHAPVVMPAAPVAATGRTPASRR